MLAEIAVIPLDKGESLNKYVAKVVSYIDKEAKKRALKYELTSMSTLIEGKDEDVWQVLRGCHEVMKKYSNRVYTRINIDDRKGKTNALIEKKSKIESLLNKYRH